MKNWKKLLLCIVLSVLVATFIGATLSVINNRVVLNIVAKYEEEVNEGLITVEEISNIEEKVKANEDINLYLNEIIKSSNSASMATMYVMTAHVTDFLYIFSIAMGVVTGTLIYLIFIKKTRAKRIILISLICFIAVFLLLNIKDMITDFYYGAFDFKDYIFSNRILQMFIVVYAIVLVALYVINFIKQKRITKKLNNELEESK